MIGRLQRLAFAAGRIAGAFSGGIRAQATGAAGPAYESASQSRRTMGWRSSTAGPNVSTLWSLSTLRDRSRERYRNDPYGGGAIDILVEQLIGCGIWPKSTAADQAFRKTVQTLFTRWAEECDADGRLDFAGLTTQATRCWLEAGEVFVRLRPRLASDGLSVPLQLQVLEPELCPLEQTLAAAAPGNREVAGIEFDALGRRTAYRFWRAHPGDAGLGVGDASQLVSVPADSVVHMYQPLRAGQIRGVPHLRRTLLTLRDLDVGDDATLLRWQLANMFMGALKRTAPMADADLDPITGAALQRDANDVPIVAMEPGAIPVLQPGEELDFNDPPEAGQTYEAFIRQQLRKVAAAARVPYHALTGDMAQVNDRTVRVILQDFRRSLEQLQWQIVIHQFCRPIWTAFFERAVLAGALEVPTTFFSSADRAPWTGVDWATDRFPYIQPVQDVEADRDEIRAGLASRADKVKARGYDVEEVDTRRAEDNARERQLGLVSDSDPSQTDRTGKLEPGPVPDAAGGATG